MGNSYVLNNISTENRMNASAFRDIWARVVFLKFSKLHEPQCNGLSEALNLLRRVKLRLAREKVQLRRGWWRGMLNFDKHYEMRLVSAFTIILKIRVTFFVLVTFLGRV